MDIKATYEDQYLVSINKEVYEKLNSIYYFETDGKKRVMKNIDEYINKIYDETNITDIKIKDTTNGYFIKYIVNDYRREIFCYTITEVIIHLRELYNEYGK